MLSCHTHRVWGTYEIRVYAGAQTRKAATDCESEGHLQEAADVEAHELPKDGQQQLVLAVHDVNTADVHQRQRQHPPRDANHLCGVVMLEFRNQDYR